MSLQTSRRAGSTRHTARARWQEALAYADEYGGAPAIANYFFYPQPSTAVAITTLT